MKKLSEEEYAKEMFGILNQLSKRRKKEFIARTLKDLKKQGKTNEWLYFALSGKEVSNWDKWGFGLLFNDKYNEYVNLRVETEGSLTGATDEETLELFNELTGGNVEEEYIEYV